MYTEVHENEARPWSCFLTLPVVLCLVAWLLENNNMDFGDPRILENGGGSRREWARNAVGDWDENKVKKTDRWPQARRQTEGHSLKCLWATCPLDCEKGIWERTKQFRGNGGDKNKYSEVQEESLWESKPKSFCLGVLSFLFSWQNLMPFGLQLSLSSMMDRLLFCFVLFFKIGISLNSPGCSVDWAVLKLGVQGLKKGMCYHTWHTKSRLHRRSSYK